MFTTTSSTAQPPSSVQVSTHQTLSGSYSYVEFGSTTPKGSVSADYFAQADEGAVSVRDQSGTIKQGAVEQSKDSNPQTVVSQIPTTTGSTPLSGWTRSVNGDGSYAWTFVWMTDSVSGDADATATGYYQDPGGGGTVGNALLDFSAEGAWSYNLDSYIVNGQDAGSGPSSPPGGGGGGGGSSAAILRSLWVLDPTRLF